MSVGKTGDFTPFRFAAEQDLSGFSGKSLVIFPGFSRVGRNPERINSLFRGRRIKHETSRCAVLISSVG
jgi:hypothetical protein